MTQLQQHAAAALGELDEEPDWAAVSDCLLKMALASKGTALESAVDWLGTALMLRDVEALRACLQRLVGE